MVCIAVYDTIYDIYIYIIYILSSTVDIYQS